MITTFGKEIEKKFFNCRLRYFRAPDSVCKGQHTDTTGVGVLAGEKN